MWILAAATRRLYSTVFCNCRPQRKPCFLISSESYSPYSIFLAASSGCTWHLLDTVVHLMNCYEMLQNASYLQIRPTPRCSCRLVPANVRSPTVAAAGSRETPPPYSGSGGFAALHPGAAAAAAAVRMLCCSTCSWEGHTSSQEVRAFLVGNGRRNACRELLGDVRSAGLCGGTGQERGCVSVRRSRRLSGSALCFLLLAS